MHPVARWGKEKRRRGEEESWEERAGWLAGGFILSLSTTYVPSTAELTGRDKMCWPKGLLETCKWINIEQWERIGVLNDISNDAHPLQSIALVQKRLMNTTAVCRQSHGSDCSFFEVNTDSTTIVSFIVSFICLDQHPSILFEQTHTQYKHKQPYASFGFAVNGSDSY